MHLTVADPALAAVLTSPELLWQAFPHLAGDVQMLLQVLRISVPSLADALGVGLISLLRPAAGPTQVVVANKQATVTADARSRDGAAITAPHESPHHVEWLDILEVAVAGRTWSGVAS